MSVGDESVLTTVKAFLDRQGISYTEKGEQHATKLELRRGMQRASVSVYNSGKIVPGGKGPLRQLLDDMKTGIESGAASPGEVLPFELDSLPVTIRSKCPSCDPVIIRFAEEALLCYKAGALLGAAFMLGAASEKAVSLLIEIYGEAIGDDKNRESYQRRIASSKSIANRYEAFSHSFKTCKPKPTAPEVANDLDVVLGSMFQFCRITRNEIGHPQIVPDLDKGVILANLGHFATYMQRIYKLIDFFRGTKIEV
jgi:hypothetical protein